MIGLGFSVTQLAVRQLLGGFNPMQLFALNEPGAWYDPSDIVLGWRYNLLSRTEQFDDGVWTKANIAVTPDAITAPNGQTTADSIVRGAFTTSQATLRVATQQQTSTPFTLSVYVKAGTAGAFLYLRNLAVNDSIPNGVSVFDPTTGTVSSSGSSYTSTSIVDVGSGWYKCSVSGQTPATIANNLIDIGVCNVPNQVGGNTGDQIYIWGASLTTASDANKPYQRITDGITDYFTYQPQPILYQDAAGTTPVTAVEQPVGMILDKSKGLVLGSELVTNGDFSSDTAWTKSAGVTISGGALNFAGVSNSAPAYQACGIAANKTYLFTFTVVSISAGSVYAQLNGGSNVTAPTVSSPGTYTARLTNPGSNGIISIGAIGATCVIDNISVRELPGNHAFQSTSASRPVLSARVNLLTKTEQFDDASWDKSNLAAFGSGSVANATTAPNGTNTADKLVPSAVSQQQRVFFNGYPTATGAYTYSVYAKSAGYNHVGITIWDGASYKGGVVFDLQAGVVLSSPAPAGIAAIESVGDGWYRVSVTATTVGSMNNSFTAIRVFPSAPTSFNESTTGDGTSGIYIWGADLRVSNDGIGLPAYQRVNTASDYDSTGFPLYLRFDGVDDWLQTNTITPGTDKAQVFAGVRKLSDAVAQVYVEFSSAWTGAAGSFALYQDSTGPQLYASASRGNAAVNANQVASVSTTFSAPRTDVISSTHDISGDSTVLRASGTQIATATGDKGTGNFLDYPLYIGRRAGTSLPFNGRLYPLIVRFGPTLTDAQITSTEQWVNGKTKAFA